MKTVQQKKCVYVECVLPENNHFFLWQILFQIIGLACLIAKESQFTFLAIFLFTTPILLDLFYNNLRHKRLNYIRYAFIAINVCIVLFCFLGISNILIYDIGDCFNIPKDAIIFSDASIKKSYIVYVLIANILIPILFYFGIPNKSSMDTVKRLRKNLEEKK